MSDPKTYHFTEQREYRFYGGRWDGHTVKGYSAPVVLALGPAGHVLAADTLHVAQDLPPGWTRYERVLVPEPVTSLPVRYVDPLNWKEVA